MERGFHMIIFKEGVNIPNVIRKVQMKYGVDIAPYVTGRELIINRTTLPTLEMLDALGLVDAYADEGIVLDRKL
jgi:hypothetical protein